MVFAAASVVWLGAAPVTASDTPLAAPAVPLASPSLPPQPVLSAPTSVWLQWAEDQATWIQSLPYAQMAAADGQAVQSIKFVPAQNVPGIPPGIVTMAAVVVTAPAAQTGASSNTAAATPAYSFNLNCAGLHNGGGSACVGYALDNGSLLWRASAEVYSFQGGYLNLGIGAALDSAL